MIVRYKKLFVETHDESGELIGGMQLRCKLIRGFFSGQAANTHSV